MSIHVALHHRTHYKYDRLVGLGPQIVRLRPAPHSRTRILSYSLHIEPKKHFINWQQDPQSNYLARLVFHEQTTEFLVEVDLVAEMAVLNPFDFFLEPEAEKFPFEYDRVLDHELEPFQLKCWLTPKFTKYLKAIRAELLGEKTLRVSKSRRTAGKNPSTFPKPRTIDFLVAVNQRLWKDIKYLIRLEPGVQAPEETLEKMSGSCRDSAWLLCQLFRHCGLAARFVSGYLIQLKADVKALDGPSGAEQDFTDLHAWCEVYLPGGGWIGLDPTSGLLAGEGHIPLACTPDPQSAAPISGAMDECETEFSFGMGVTRIYESPRVTLPYTDEQWKRIESLGHAIDTDLKRGDARLTMGGEPTFISIDDPDGPEWNFTAVSHKKRILSGELIKRLRKKFAPGSLLHYGQGKWYPGEQLPRWALGCYWRKDGVPIWNDDSLIADESKNYGHGAKDAKELLARISRVVGADPKFILPGYEDEFYYTWKERRLPSNVTPEKSNLKNKLERDRIAKLFQQGLDEVTGYMLPIKRVWYGNQQGWMSGAWFLRDNDTLWLIPGDSPMGLRLPLDSIPWVAEKDFPWLWQ
ncbi:MAG TPA: transglutaminase family protein, partial [Candidatus Acidoferrales bacterium]|nr:transglutaminase family protein [Candidatus Acidoferrales bacterium]